MFRRASGVGVLVCCLPWWALGRDTALLCFLHHVWSSRSQYRAYALTSSCPPPPPSHSRFTYTVISVPLEMTHLIARHGLGIIVEVIECVAESNVTEFAP